MHGKMQNKMKMTYSQSVHKKNLSSAKKEEVHQRVSCPHVPVWKYGVVIQENCLEENYHVIVSLLTGILGWAIPSNLHPESKALLTTKVCPCAACCMGYCPSP